MSRIPTPADLPCDGMGKGRKACGAPLPLTLATTAGKRTGPRDMKAGELLLPSPAAIHRKGGLVPCLGNTLELTLSAVVQVSSSCEHESRKAGLWGMRM